MANPFLIGIGINILIAVEFRELTVVNVACSGHENDIAQSLENKIGIFTAMGWTWNAACFG